MINHEGFYNNDGGYGTVTLNVTTGEWHNSHSDYETITHDSDNSGDISDSINESKAAEDALRGERGGGNQLRHVVSQLESLTTIAKGHLKAAEDHKDGLVSDSEGAPEVKVPPDS